MSSIEKSLYMVVPGESFRFCVRAQVALSNYKTVHKVHANFVSSFYRADFFRCIFPNQMVFRSGEVQGNPYNGFSLMVQEEVLGSVFSPTILILVNEFCDNPILYLFLHYLSFEFQSIL